MQIISIAGRVGKSAETRTTGSGKDVTSFSVAVSNGKDKPPTWYDCAIWDKRGVSLQPHINKGDNVAVSGRPGARCHNDKAYLQVTVDQFSFMGGSNNRNQSQGNVSRSTRQEAQSESYDDSDFVPF